MAEAKMDAARAEVSRRGLLKVGLVGTALATVGGVGLALRGPALRELPQGLRVFDAKEFSIAVSVAEAICPPPGDASPGAVAVGVAEKLDALFAGMAPAVQAEAKLLFSIFDNALMGLAFERRVAPFSKLSLEARRASLQRWAESDVAFRRTAYLTLRGLCAAFYYCDERTWPGIGYPGPPHAVVAAVRPARRAKLAEEQRLAILNSRPEVLSGALPTTTPAAPAPDEAGTHAQDAGTSAQEAVP